VKFVPLFQNVDLVDEYNFNNVKPIISNEYGEIDYLQPITAAGSIATTGKGLSDIITITDDTIDVDLSDQTMDNPGFNKKVKLTFFNMYIPEEQQEILVIYDSLGNQMEVHDMEYSPLSFEVLGFGNTLDCIDADADGYIGASGYYCTGTLDCDDSKSNTYPGATELCDTKDNDCDGIVDEGHVCHECYGRALPKDNEYDDGYLEIWNCCDLQNIAQNLTANYLLKRDIDCYSTKDWNNYDEDCSVFNNKNECNNMDGCDWNNGLIKCVGFEGFRPIDTFTGTLDGKNHKIKDLYIDHGGNSVGLFKHISGTVKNIGLENVDIKGAWWVGPIASALTGRLENCYTTGTVTTEGNYAVGGLVGTASGHSTGYYLNNSYSVTSITGPNKKGGLIGAQEGGSNAKEFINSYWDTEVSGLTTTAGRALIKENIEGKTTTEMKQQSTYVGWDFDNVWTIDPSINNGYPYLK